MIVRITPEGVEHSDPPANPTLEEMQAFVGGYIQLLHVVYGDEPADMYVNEDGQRLNLPLNPGATRVFQESHLTSDVILGPALILTGRHVEYSRADDATEEVSRG